MGDCLFDNPIYVKVGCFLSIELASLHDALFFLDKWPKNDRDFIYDVTWKTCCDVHDGVKPIRAAETVVKGFARKRGILDHTNVPHLLMSPRSEKNTGHFSA